MKNKNSKIASTSVIHEPKMDITNSLCSKVNYFQDIIQKTVLAVQKYKNLDILGANEINVCTQGLEKLFQELDNIVFPLRKQSKYDTNQIVTDLQNINNELSTIFRTYGTENIEDLINVCFGKEYINTSNFNADKFEVLQKYFHPINYKVMNWKTERKNGANEKILQKNRIVEDFMIVEKSDNLACFDLARTSKSFQTKVYGIKVAVHNEKDKKTLIICGIVDDIILDCLNFNYVDNKVNSLISDIPKDPDFHTASFGRFIKCLTIKELLIYNNDELYNRYMGYISQVHLIKQKTISQVVKEFINSELYGQRTTLIQLLLKSNEHEYQYLAYLLYDLLSNDTNGSIDTQEQTLLFDSLPWTIKKFFRDAMKQTIQYTNNLSNFDNSKIPLEQQICLMKASDSVKEKAMLKLKEVKSKSEDSGSKARQYLEGLLKVPFGIYRHEPILSVMQDIRKNFSDLMKRIHSVSNSDLIPLKESYTSVEVKKYSKTIEKSYMNDINKNFIHHLKQQLTNEKRNGLIVNICTINNIIKINNLKKHKLCHSGKKTSYMKNEICEFIDSFNENPNVINELAKKFNLNNGSNDTITTIIKKDMNHINTNWSQITDYIDNTDTLLDNAVHGHKHAKRQIARIMGQWINGEQSGYCFGFEGPPGIGKTSLAKKGLANCLTDNDGVSRPFAFIAIGGSSNGSTLDGHNYTYVGSTWGRIVDILMDKKCMNPIIFIDELDKISRTEQGREIIGILTHLIDATQNDSFQDKYFTGIDLDLSKALFIFSYNDVSAIDRVLLDRIHRIKFDNLSLDDKVTITRKYILPEIYKKMGLEDIIELSDENIIYIIDEYTYESGVRKLKDILFEIIGEINLEGFNKTKDMEIPIKITNHDIKYKYLKERHEIIKKIIHPAPLIGTINGLWANSMGKGGIIPIEARYFPSGTFLDLKLTGMQGDVMKESMSVARTLAWSLLPKGVMKKCADEFKRTKLQGIHVHCPEGAVPKDGPSAGTAITIVLHSLFSGRKIKNDIAITGEMNLQGSITAIGGLDLKILGGIRAGVKEFIYPEENKKDFKDFMDKYSKKDLVKGIVFHPMKHISDVMEIVFTE